MRNNFFTKNVHKVRKGFTLVELLIVVLILGVLAGSMLLSSGKSVAAAKATKIIADMTVIKDAVLTYYMENVGNEPSIEGFCDNAQKYLGDSAMNGLSKKLGTGGQSYNANNLVLQLGDIYFQITYPPSEPNKWYVEAFFPDDPDRNGIREKLKERASSIPLFKTEGKDNEGNDIANVHTVYYDGVDFSVFMRIL